MDYIVPLKKRYTDFSVGGRRGGAVLPLTGGGADDPAVRPVCVRRVLQCEAYRRWLAMLMARAGQHPRGVARVARAARGGCGR